MKWKDTLSLPQAFKAAGYKTLSTGKIFHQQAPQQLAADFDEVGKAGGVGVKPEKKLIGPTPMGNNPLMDWGAFPHKDEDKGDYQVATWAAEKLATLAKTPDEPFFLAAGFFLPHVPAYATPEWLEKYPNDDSILPKVLEGDRDDTPRFSWNLHWYLPEPRLPWLKENKQWHNLVRSYLASTSFVDAQVGRVMEALKNSGLGDNTVVVVWSDHGWHLGEKNISGKNSLWERTTRVPLIFAGPGVTSGGRCSQPAELLDMFPTLLDLCGIEAKSTLDGVSLKPQLRDAAAKRERPAITSACPGNHGIRTETHRYIRYADGSEELYDMVADPQEWKNLAASEDGKKIIASLQKYLPTNEADFVPRSSDRVLTYDAKTGETTWEGKKIEPGAAIPGF
jgi:choline-sulfatase